MRFIVDEDVPKSAADLLIERHHEVTHVHDVLLPGSEDHLVAKWGHEHVAIVVTCNARHFASILNRASYARAGLLCLPQPHSTERLSQFLDLLEAEGERLGDEGRLWLEVRDTTVLIRR